MFWELELEGHEKADGFQRVEPLVDIVPQEDILVTLHLVLIGEAKVFEETEKVEEAAIDTAEDLDRRPDSH